MSRATKRTLVATGVAVLVAATILQLVVPAEETTWYDHVPFFSGLLGFVGAAAFILGSRWLGRLWLQRPDTYYADEERAFEVAPPATHDQEHPHG